MAQTQSLAKERDALKDQCAEMKARSKQLERRVASMEDELHDAADKATMAMEERDKLTAEKTALINTVKKLNKEVAKLDAFKRNLMQTLADDGEDGAGGAGDAAGERLVTSVLASADANENRFGERGGRYGGSQTERRGHPNASPGERPPPRRPRVSSAASPLGEANGSSGDGSSAAARKVDGGVFPRSARAFVLRALLRVSAEHQGAQRAQTDARRDAGARRRHLRRSNKDLFRTFETLLVKHLPKRARLARHAFRERVETRRARDVRSCRVDG